MPVFPSALIVHESRISTVEYKASQLAHRRYAVLVLTYELLAQMRVLFLLVDPCPVSLSSVYDISLGNILPYGIHKKHLHHVLYLLNVYDVLFLFKSDLNLVGYLLRQHRVHPIYGLSHSLFNSSLYL